MTSLPRSALLLLLLHCCNDKGSLPPPRRVDAGGAAVPSARAAPSSSAAAAASLPLPSSSGRAAEPLDLPNGFPNDCKDPRVVLAIRKELDRSGRILVQQVLVANPELRVVPEHASAPSELDFYETTYGTKLFSQLYPGQPRFSEAVVARCSDVSTCQAIARAVTAASPSDQPLLVCGVPPATTGGFKRVPELALAQLVPPPERASRSSYCARVRACSSRKNAASEVPEVCRKLGQDLSRCARLADCESVTACALAAVH